MTHRHHALDLLDEFGFAGERTAAAEAIAEVLERGFVRADHFRRVFASLRDARALPPEADGKFARHFGSWLEVINQPYFKPIITSPHRLDRLIDVLARNEYVPVADRSVLIVDLGTGHPPYTTANLAERLPRAAVHGFDLYAPSHLVRRETGEYALFRDGTRLVSVHAPTLAQLHALVIDWRATSDGFAACLASRGRHGCAPCTVVEDPTQAIQHACANPRLRFHVNADGGFDLRDLGGDEADVIWSFNCLLHYELPEREAAMRSIGLRVRQGGIVFEGYTSPRGDHAVFSVWQRDGSSLQMREFGFSRANFGFPLWPLHGRDPQVELLNRLLALVKTEAPADREGPRAADIVSVLGAAGYDARTADEFVVVRPRTTAAELDFPSLPIVSRGASKELAWVPA